MGLAWRHIFPGCFALPGDGLRVLAATTLLNLYPASATPLCQPPGEGFDCRPLQLQEALAQPVDPQVAHVAQQNLTGAGADSPDRGNGGKANGANPDSEQVLEEEAREGNSEALAKQAQNPIASLISFPIQWNSIPGTQWAPRAIEPTAQANRTLNVWNVQPVVPFPLNDHLTLISRTMCP